MTAAATGSGYDWFIVASYFASAFTAVAFFMRAIVPLRLAAIAANLGFLLYGIGTGNPATVILHLGLLPLNVVRIVQHTRLVRRVRDAIEGEPNIEKLLPLMKRNRMAKGTEIFRKGDWAEEMYFLSEGRVEFPEVRASIGSGKLFGEIALFLQDRARTASAVCAEDCVVYSLTEAKVLELAVVDPFLLL